MKKVASYLVILTFAVFMSTNSFSQGGFSIHAGTAIPISDFADDDVNNDEGGGASIGFNIGGKYQYALNEGGLGLYLGTSLNYNGLKKSIKDDLKESFSDMGTNVDIKYTKFLNIPVTAGLYYNYKANESVSLFGELGLGVDFLKMTDMKLKANGQEASFVTKSKAQLAYEFGAGLMMQDKYIIEIQYCGLGKHSLTHKIEYDGGSEDLGESDIKVSMVTVTFGFKF